MFEFTPSGAFHVLHTVSALDANGHNWDGAFPLPAMIVGSDGKLYGSTRLGGPNTCLFTHGCGVAWVIDRWGFRVIHSFTADEGHAASQIQAQDGKLYGCAVWPATALPPGPLPSGTLYRMTLSGEDFEVLYRFGQTDANGENVEGAHCYEPLVETSPGVFYGTAFHGGTNGNGTVFRYSNSDRGTVDVMHEFSAMNAAGQNGDGAGPFGRLALAPNGVLYSNTEAGGATGNGVLFSLRQDGHFEVVHTFSAPNATTGTNWDGSLPDEGLIVDGNRIIGIAVYGGNGSPAGYLNSGGTLYELTFDKF